MLSMPTEDIHFVDAQTVAMFERCSEPFRDQITPVVVVHLDTESMIGLEPGETGLLRLNVGTPRGHTYLADLMTDQSLRAELEGMASREARCG